MRLHHALWLCAFPLLGCTTKTGNEWVKDLPTDTPPNKAEAISVESAERPGAMDAEDFGEPRGKAARAGARADAGTIDELDDIGGPQ